MLYGDSILLNQAFTDKFGGPNLSSPGLGAIDYLTYSHVQTLVQQLEADKPGSLVFGLGFNDLGGNEDPLEYRQNFDIALAMIRSRCPHLPILLVGVWPAEPDEYATWLATRTYHHDDYNQQLQELADIYPLTQFVSPSDIVMNTKFYSREHPLFGFDWIHPTENQGHEYLVDKLCLQMQKDKIRFPVCTTSNYQMVRGCC